ncbi:Prss57 [Acrasis kona]|uniref:Prss57 n=1 Tax=Acrasis kona TaxID=1008807 RepID=A0AAW2Z4X4_9EUKA
MYNQQQFQQQQYYANSVGSSKNKATFLMFGLILSILCPFLVPIYFYWRSTGQPIEGMGGGSFSFTLLSVVIIFTLTLLLWIPGVIAALVYANYVGLPIANRYFGSY